MEKVQYKNVVFTVWDVGGQEKLRALWRHYFNNTDGLVRISFHYLLGFILMKTQLLQFGILWSFPSITKSFITCYRSIVARLIHMCIFMQIYVVDSLDRERIGKAKQEFQVIKSKCVQIRDVIPN